MAVPVPIVERIDQTTDTIVIRSAVSGATLSLTTNGKQVVNTTQWPVLDLWALSGNTGTGAGGSGFGNLADGRPFWLGQFSTSIGVDILFYSPGDGNWWLGQFNGPQLSWSLAGNTLGKIAGEPNFGQVADGRPFWIGDFSRAGRSDILFYSPGDQNWWLGQCNGTTISWFLAGNTKGFGQVGDGRPFWTGDFSGSGRTELLFYSPGDGNWWLGQFTGATLSWAEAGNTLGKNPGQPNFGQVADGRPFWTGNFSGTGRSDILFYSPGDGNWWLGQIAGTTLSWTNAGNTLGKDPGQPNFGQLADGRPFWTGNFSGTGPLELLFYFPGDGNWWLGQFNQAHLSWSLAGNTLGATAGAPSFGQISDGRPVWAGNFTGSYQHDILFYFPGDQNWWLGVFRTGKLSWSLAGNTRGFGQVWDKRPFWKADFQGIGRESILSYSPSDGNWQIGWFDRAQFRIPNLLTPGDVVVATQTLNGVASASAPVTVELAYATQHFDRFRTGWNPYERALTVASATKSLGLLFTQSLDGQAYAQPLYVPGLSIPGKGTHNVIFVATENATIYAFDADTASGLCASPLCKRSLPMSSQEIPVPAVDITGGCVNIMPSIGVTGTPVIDLANGVLYVVVAIKATAAPVKHMQRLHVLDLTTLADRPESPIEIQATSGPSVFDPLQQNQRPGLLLQRGAVYIAWGSHCDQVTYHGWMIGYETAGLNQIGVFNAAPDLTAKEPFGAGIWQGGIAPACDADGAIYCSTGNGDYSAQSGGTGHGHCILKLSPSLALLDFFMPFNVAALDVNDWDLGSGAPILIPQQPGDPHPLLTVCGKEGRIYVLNRSGLGGFNSAAGAEADTNILQELPLYPGQSPDGPGQPAGTDTNQPGVWGGPAYATVGAKRLVFFCGDYGKAPGATSSLGGPVRAFSVTAAAQPFAPDVLADGSPNQSTVFFPAINAGGATPVVSSSGADATTAIVWLIRRVRPLLGLVALNAADLTGVIAELTAGPWNNPKGSPMIEPTVINGKVYVAADGQVSVFGL